MADELKAPVAIRITRPYATEDEFLEREFDTLTHTSVILLGAQSRPQGVVLRFEVALQSGESILRGEARVVAFKEKAYGGEPGLTLRFTRLDSRSKALVDRAAALRDARARGPSSTPSVRNVEAPPAAPSSAQTLQTESPIPVPAPLPSQPPPSVRRGPPPLPDWARSEATLQVATSSSRPPPPPAPSSAEEIDLSETQVEPTRTVEPRVRTPPPPPPRGTPPTSARPPPIAPTPLRVPSSRPPPSPPPPPPEARSRSAPPPSLQRPAERATLLDKLRARARSLPPERVEEILTTRAHRR